MVGAITRIIGINGAPTNERCMELAEALNIERHGSIDPPMSVLRRRVDGEPKDYLDSNVRVADQEVIVNTVGCGRESNDVDTVPVVVACPDAAARRCAACILQLPDGEKVRSQMGLTIQRFRPGL
jgi:hypothetical protein